MYFFTILGSSPGSSAISFQVTPSTQRFGTTWIHPCRRAALGGP